MFQADRVKCAGVKEEAQHTLKSPKEKKTRSAGARGGRELKIVEACKGKIWDFSIHFDNP